MGTYWLENNSAMHINNFFKKIKAWIYIFFITNCTDFLDVEIYNSEEKMKGGPRLIEEYKEMEEDWQMKL